MKSYVFLFLFLIVAMFSAKLPGAVTLEPSQDTDVYQFTGRPTSTQFSLNITPPTGHGLKSIVQFAVTQANVGFGADEVAEATLRLYVLAPLGDLESFGAGSIEAYFQTAAWTEPDIRWPDFMPGAKVGTIEVTGHSTESKAAFVELDVTDAVRAWLSGSVANHGLILQSPTDGSGAATAFGARDFNPLDASAVPPQLIIEQAAPDTDGDGYADADEAAWGSNPADAGSIPVALAWESGSLSYNTWAGHEYQLQVSNDLEDWDPVGSRRDGDGSRKAYSISNDVPPPGVEFYRVADVTGED